MDTSRPTTTIDPIDSAKALPERKRQHRSPELKRQLVEESLAPGASVARVARAHGVNANQLFAWRRQYRQGLLASGIKSTPGLLAVRVADLEVPGSEVPMPRAMTGTIQVELPKGKLRLTGMVDTEALQILLKELLA